jgi:hypothetical protein
MHTVNNLSELPDQDLADALRREEAALSALRSAFPELDRDTSPLDQYGSAAERRLFDLCGSIALLKLELLRREKDVSTTTRAPTQEQPAKTPRVSEPEPPGGFAHTSDYRSVTLRGATHSLTGRQAQVIQILHGAYENGTPDVGNASILEELGTPSDRLRDTFKSNMAAWKALIARGKRRGTHRLNL